MNKAEMKSPIITRPFEFRITRINAVNTLKGWKKLVYKGNFKLQSTTKNKGWKNKKSLDWRNDDLFSYVGGTVHRD